MSGLLRSRFLWPAVAFVLGTLFAVVMLAGLNRGAATDAQAQVMDRVESTMGAGGPLRGLIAEQLADSGALGEIGAAAQDQQRQNALVTVAIASAAAIAVAGAASVLQRVGPEEPSPSGAVQRVG